MVVSVVEFFEVVVGGCRWFWVVLGRFRSFHVLVTMLDGYRPLSRIWILLFSVTNRASCWTESHLKGLMMSYTGQGT